MFESFCSFSISAITFDAWFSAFSLKRADLSGCACCTGWVASVLTVDAGVFVVILGLMDNTPTGKLIRSILLAFAEFERDMIVERTQEGRRLSGHYGGRPPKYKRE